MVKARKGFTLTEILIAMTVLIVGLVGILALFPIGLRATRKAIEDTHAALIAESVYSSLRTSVRQARKDGSNIKFFYFHDGVNGGNGQEVSIPTGSTDSIYIPAGPPIGGTPPTPNTDNFAFLAQEGGNFNITTNSNWVKDDRPIAGHQSLDQYGFNIELKKSDIDGLYDVIIRIVRRKRLIKKFYTQIAIPLAVN